MQARRVVRTNKIVAFQLEEDMMLRLDPNYGITTAVANEWVVIVYNDDGGIQGQSAMSDEEFHKHFREVEW